jgi:uncharacterized membrane protein
MSPETLRWVLVGHVFGFVTWIGGLLTCMSLLHVHTRVEESARAALTSTERQLAMLMDLGATLAIATGFTMAFETHEFGHGAWLHVKLTVIVLGILSAHGMVRAKIKKFSRGEIKALPRWMFTIVLAAAAIAIALGANVALLR